SQSKSLRAPQLGWRFLASAMASTTAAAVWCGLCRGARDRSSSPANPHFLNRSSHLCPVTRLIPKRWHSSVIVNRSSSAASTNRLRSRIFVVSLQGIGPPPKTPSCARLLTMSPVYSVNHVPGLYPVRPNPRLQRTRAALPPQPVRGQSSSLGGSRRAPL